MTPNRRGLFSASATGVLAYTRMGRLLAQLTWKDREGNTLDTVGDPGFFANLDLSKDDLHVAVSELREQPGGQSNVDIYLIDLTRAGTSSRLTDHARREFDPAWSPNGLYIAFNSDRADASRYSLYVRQANRSGEDDLLVKTQTSITAPAWSPNGGVIVYSEWAAASGADFDLWTVALAGDRKPAVFLRTPYDEASGASRRKETGSHTSRTSRAAAKCTSDRFRSRRDSFRSHAMEDEPRDGVLTARSSFFWHRTGP